MARKTAAVYIQFHTDGNAARQPELRPVKKPAPRPRKKPVVVLRIQPLALAGILLSAVMLICMFCGALELRAARKARTDMANLANHLAWENGILEEAYYQGLDLERIRQEALALGMVPEEQVTLMTVPVEEPQAQVSGGIRQELGGFFRGLFSRNGA